MKDNIKQEEIKTTYLIHESKLPRIRDRIKKLNNKARKLNCPEMKIIIDPEPTYIKEKPTSINNEPASTVPKKLRFFNVKVEGATPIIDGWEFVGIILDDGLTTTIHKHPEASITPDLVKFYTKREKTCDHCNHNRYRKDTYLVKKVDSGEMKQVGSGCIRDFLGHIPLKRFLEFYELMGEYEEEPIREERGIKPEYFESTKWIMANVAHFTRKYGWVSKEKAAEKNKLSTSDRVYNNLWERNPEYYEKPDKEMEEIGIKALQYVLNEILPRMRIYKSTFDEYLDSLDNLIPSALNDGVINVRNIGYFIPLVMMMDNDIRRIENKKLEKETSEYVGQPGERKERELTFYDSFGFDSSWGYTNVYRFKDANKNLWIWMTGNHKDFEKDKIYKIVGTIKRHQEYKGVKQNLLTRCKIKK